MLDIFLAAKICIPPLILELSFFYPPFHWKIEVIGCDAFDVLVIGSRSKLILLQELKQNLSISLNFITHPQKIKRDNQHIMPDKIALNNSRMIFELITPSESFDIKNLNTCAFSRFENWAYISVLWATYGSLGLTSPQISRRRRRKCKILAKVSSLCWNSEGGLQKLSSPKVETLKKPWARQCNAQQKFRSLFWRQIFLASQIFDILQYCDQVERSNGLCKLFMRVTISNSVPCNKT